MILLASTHRSIMQQRPASAAASGSAFSTAAAASAAQPRYSITSGGGGGFAASAAAASVVQHPSCRSDGSSLRRQPSFSAHRHPPSSPSNIVDGRPPKNIVDGRPASIVDGGLRNIFDGINSNRARELQLCWLSHAPAAWLASAMRACSSKSGHSARSTRSSEHSGF